ncbi:MAG: hypothetical protein SFW08_13630 [Gemmatimonadaceae bacterium]|nr:hypothetical protein [Gemmatimonadaceae bacterium]
MRRVRTLTARVAILATAVSVTAAALAPAAARSQGAGTTDVVADVRQIVTFRWLPGREADATAIYTGPLRAIYDRVPAIGRVRVFREAESPEPLDLVVVTHYASMAQMDTANAQLRTQSEGGRRALQFYGDLSAMSAGHHDQFVEMLPHLRVSRDTASAPRGALVVYEYLRAVPGGLEALERELELRVRPAERASAAAWRSETGRMLVSDGWTHLRIHTVSSLGAWQQFVAATRTAPTHRAYERQIAARKIIILRHLPDADVR